MTYINIDNAMMIEVLKFCLGPFHLIQMHPVPFASGKARFLCSCNIKLSASAGVCNPFETKVVLVIPHLKKVCLIPKLNQCHRSFPKTKHVFCLNLTTHHHKFYA